MSEITTAILARQTQITQLQSDIETLQRAASIVAGKTKSPAEAASQPKPKATLKTTPKAKRKRKPWSAAAKKAMSKRVKAYWAKRRKAKG